MNRINCNDVEIQKIYLYIDSSDYTNSTRPIMVRIIKNDSADSKIVIQNIMTSELIAVPKCYTYFQDLSSSEISLQIQHRKAEVMRLTAQIERLESL